MEQYRHHKIELLRVISIQLKSVADLVLADGGVSGGGGGGGEGEGAGGVRGHLSFQNKISPRVLGYLV